MIVPKDLKLKSNNSIHIGLHNEEVRGGSAGRKGVGRSVFFLSRSVNPKHNPCTYRMMLRCCPIQILTESINLTTMELWNSLPDSPSRPSLLDNSAER